MRNGVEFLADNLRDSMLLAERTPPRSVHDNCSIGKQRKVENINFYQTNSIFILLLRSFITMSAIFDFSSLITVLLLLICTCAYLRELRPGIFDDVQVSAVR